VTVRSARLFGPTELTTTGSVVVYTVPDGRTALLKSIRMVNTDPSSCTLIYGVGGVDPSDLFWPAADIPGVSVVTDDALIVLSAGDQLVMKASRANVLTVSGHGALLVGVAS
jgi:hypothetical protein